MRFLTKTGHNHYLRLHSSGNALMLRVCLFNELREQQRRIHIEHPRDLNEFHHVHASLAGLDTADKGMRALESRGEIALRKPGLIARRNDQFDQGAVTSTSQGLPQSRSGHGARLRIIGAPSITHEVACSHNAIRTRMRAPTNSAGKFKCSS
jgi:hypothetical protein